MNILKAMAILVIVSLPLSQASHAAPRIAVLSFELNDITSLPNTSRERQRTASIRPLLEKALTLTGDYQIVEISREAQASANSGFGYLYRFHDLAAKLGAEAGVDWVIVGQHSKPSFLFSYLMTQLIDVKTGKLSASYEIELKGNHEKVTQHAVSALAKKIQDTVSSHR